MDMTVREQLTEEMTSVVELVELLKKNQKVESAANVVAMAAYVGQIDTKLDQLLKEVNGVQEQLKNVQEMNDKKSITVRLKETLDSLAVQYNKLKEELKEIKNAMKQKAGEIVKAVKKLGVKALNGVAEFFKIGEKLKKFEDRTKTNLAKVDDTIDRLDKFGKGMDEAKNQAAKSVSILTGKNERKNLKSIASKIEVIKKPFVKEKEILENILQLTDKALNKCAKLSQEAKGWYPGEFVQGENFYQTAGSVEKKQDDIVKKIGRKKR